MYTQGRWVIHIQYIVCIKYHKPVHYDIRETILWYGEY